MTQICVFNTCFFSLHNTLNYAIHGACLRRVLLTDVYRNLTSLWIKPRECAFKQFKNPILNVLRNYYCLCMCWYHLSKSFAVRINFSGLCSFKFNSMAHPVVMLCQDGDRVYIVMAWQILQNWWVVDTGHYSELYWNKVWIQKTIYIIFISLIS